MVHGALDRCQPQRGGAADVDRLGIEKWLITSGGGVPPVIVLDVQREVAVVVEETLFIVDVRGAHVLGAWINV